MSKELQTNEGAFPFPMPKPFEAPKPTIAHVMEILGYRENEYRVEGAGPRMVLTSELIDVGRDENASHKISAMGDDDFTFADVEVPVWWDKDGETLVIFENATPENILDNKDGKGLGYTTKEDVSVYTERPWLKNEGRKYYKVVWEPTFDAKKRGVREVLWKEDYLAKEKWKQEFFDRFFKVVNGDWSTGEQGSPIFKALPTELKQEITREKFSRLDNFGEILERIKEAWPAAVALADRIEKHEVIVDLYPREGQRASEAWVVRPDGSLREKDSTRQYWMGEPQGNPTGWHIVESDELALSWSKNSIKAPHDFVVEKRVLGGETPAQLEAVRKLQEEAQNKWREMGYGESVGEMWGPVGGGWGLLPYEERPQESKETSVTKGSVQQEEKAPASLDDLLAKFGGEKTKKKDKKK